MEMLVFLRQIHSVNYNRFMAKSTHAVINILNLDTHKGNNDKGYNECVNA